MHVIAELKGILMVYFQYHPHIAQKFPQLVGGVLYAHDVESGPSPSALSDAYRREQEAVLARVGQQPLSAIPSLAAWRGVFRAFGVDPTQYRSAAEALLRRLTKKGDIPFINRLVDMGNLVSIRYALPVAILDTRYIRWPVTVHFAEGTEPFQPLNEGSDADQVEYPAVGEVVFTDATRQVLARRWCWRQSASSAARDDTAAILVTVEAHHDEAQATVAAAVDDLKDLLRRYADASVDGAILHTDELAY